MDFRRVGLPKAGFGRKAISCVELVCVRAKRERVKTRTVSKKRGDEVNAGREKAYKKYKNSVKIKRMNLELEAFSVVQNLGRKHRLVRRFTE